MDSWDDALKALRNGDIDLLGRTNDRRTAKYFDYRGLFGGSHTVRSSPIMKMTRSLMKILNSLTRAGLAA